MKHANITPVFKNRYRGSQENYQPVITLPAIYKIFEKLLCNQTTPFMDQFLSTNVVFERDPMLSIAFLPLAMLEKRKKAVDTKKVFGALLTDLSKAFDCLPRDLIIA